MSGNRFAQNLVALAALIFALGFFQADYPPKAMAQDVGPALTYHVRDLPVTGAASVFTNAITNLRQEGCAYRIAVLLDPAGGVDTGINWVTTGTGAEEASGDTFGTTAYSGPVNSNTAITAANGWHTFVVSGHEGSSYNVTFDDNVTIAELVIDQIRTAEF